VVVIGAGGVASYTPAAGYCGPDSFKFRANDGACRSDEATVSVTVTCLNRCPVAVASAGPRSDLFPELPAYFIIASNNTNACVRLDGSQSSDPDGDALSYHWLPLGGQTPVAEGVTPTVCLEVGQYSLVLVVDDGRCSDTTGIDLEILTPAEAVDALVSAVNGSDLERRAKRPLIASLKAAAASFDRGSCQAGLNQLEAFQNKVRAQVTREHPDAARELGRLAQIIIDGVTCPTP
jgi:hypothetical protein